MKLWLLRPIDENKVPWDPWYDRAFGFVVRAETEEEAREIGDLNGGSELGTIMFNADRHAEGRGPWRDSLLSTCEELLPDGDAGVVMRDFAAA